MNEKGVTSIPRALSRFAVGLRFEDLSEEIVKDVKRHTLDTLGCVLGTYGLQRKSVKIVLDFIKSMGGKEESTIFGDGEKVPCSNAALINAFQAETSEYCGLHPVSWIIPGEHVVPAVLAAAEREKAQGKDVITSILLGYDVMLRIGRAFPLFFDLHGTGETVLSHVDGLQSIGTTVAVGKILQLDEDSMVNAIGIDGVRCLESKERMNKNVYNGIWPALNVQNAVYAAMLAQGGIPGPETIIEGESGLAQITQTKYDINKIIEGLGKTFTISEVWLKYYASCYFCHPSIEAAIGAMRKYRINTREIDEITVKAYSENAALLWEPLDDKRKPRSYEDAQFSIPYCVALGILKGHVTLDNFTEEAIKNPEILDLTKKINVTGSSEFKWHEAEITIKMKDQKTYNYYADYPKGATKNPITNVELQDKFKSLASKTIGEDKAQKIIYMVNRLEEIDDITELTELLKKT